MSIKRICSVILAAIAVTLLLSGCKDSGEYVFELNGPKESMRINIQGKETAYLLASVTIEVTDKKLLSTFENKRFRLRSMLNECGSELKYDEYQTDPNKEKRRIAEKMKNNIVEEFELDPADVYRISFTEFVVYQ